MRGVGYFVVTAAAGGALKSIRVAPAAVAARDAGGRRAGDGRRHLPQRARARPRRCSTTSCARWRSLRDQGEIASSQAAALADEQLDFVVQIWSVDGRSIYASRQHSTCRRGAARPGRRQRSTARLAHLQRGDRATA
jgi:hypothetical protein